MFKPRKVGWLDQGRRLCEGGGNCVKHLKRGWNRKEGRGNKNLKKGGGGKLGQEVGALKRGGWNPITNYDTIISPGQDQEDAVSKILVSGYEYNKLKI